MLPKRKQLAVRVFPQELELIKIKLDEENMTFQEYVMELIRKDMEDYYDSDKFRL